MSTDGELLARYVRENSQAAFAELVQRHLALVYGTALRHVGGDAHLAQDVAQAVFSDLARKAAALRDHTALAGWLYLGAHHAAAQVVRGERRRRTREEEAQAMHEQNSAGAPGEWEQVRPVIDDALRDLAETDREAVLLRFFEQRPFRDVGAALNLREDAARMRVDRALEKLRAALARRGVTSSGTALAAALAQQGALAMPAGLVATIAGAATAGLAVGGGAGSAAATIFAMKTPLLVSMAVALAALGGVFYQARQARQLEAELASAQRSQAEWRARFEDAQRVAAQREEQIARVAQERAAARQEAPVAPPAKPAAVPMRGTLTLSSGGETRGVTLTAENARAQLRTAVDETFPPLYRKLGLNEAQRLQFRELMVDRREAWDRLLAAARAQGQPMGRELARQTFEQANAEAALRVRAVFGDAAAEALAYFEDTRPLRSHADQLARALFYSDTPLTPAQAEQLIDIMAANVRTADGRIDAGLELSGLNSAGLLAQAQTILSPAQFAKLREIETRRLEQRAQNDRGGATTIVRLPGT